MSLLEKLFRAALPASPDVHHPAGGGVHFPTPRPQRPATSATEGEPHELTARELKQWIKEARPFQLLDIREAEEVRKSGWIPGMRPIPKTQVPIRLNELDRAQPLVIYSRGGISAFEVGCYLAQEGYSRVYILRGGFSHWDGPIERL